MSAGSGKQWTRRGVLGGATAAAATAGFAGWSAALSNAIESGATSTQPAMRLSGVSQRAGWTEGSIGVTSQGRQIVRWDTRPAGATRHVMIMSGIHGNEPITYPLASAITRARRPDDLHLTVVPSVNPDGWAVQSRRNARGVDLNRNYPWRWRPSTGGPGPGSELETKAVMATLRAERPDLVIWIHQPLAWVAPLLGCPREYAARWADASGVRVRETLDQHGGSETWTARGAGLRSMLVEVTSFNSTQRLVDDHVRGFEALMPIVVRDPNR